jgi:hypothetical protein
LDKLRKIIDMTEPINVTRPAAGRIMITLSMSVEDGGRLQQALATGKLAELGIEAVLVNTTDRNSKWQRGEAEKHTPAGDGTRPLHGK